MILLTNKRIKKIIKEITNDDYFIMQQEDRNGKLYYSIRSNFDMQILEKKFFKTLHEAKNFFKEKLPKKNCYYNRMVKDSETGSKIKKINLI